ncbi:hypothetical protein [Sphingobacterium cellulitidis]|uniref:hypothetical protein n=1 Tax=Sphingobacterium cellulitidis TaxID=1768011 RepID=UPI003C7E0CE5
MSFLQSIKSAGFKLDGLKEFPGTTFKINISFTVSNISEQDIIKCEWFLDGILIENENGFEVSGEGYCGEHIIAARILTREGWSGLNTLEFTNCISKTSAELRRPTQVYEGQTAVFDVFHIFTDQTESKATKEYIFSASNGGTFHLNSFYADHNNSLIPQTTVEIFAKFGGQTLPSKALTIYNIDKPTIDLSEFDFIVTCNFWQHAATDGLDVLVGFENNNSVNNNQYVGYSDPTDKIPAEANGLDQGYLFWSNDSVQSTGEESVLINLKKFSSDFSTNAKVGDFSFMDFAEPDFSVDDKNNIGQIGLYSIWRGNSLGTGFFSRLLRGDSAFYSLDIIAKNIKLQLPFGKRLVLNQDEDFDSNVSSLPISFQWQINSKKI